MERLICLLNGTQCLSNGTQVDLTFQVLKHQFIICQLTFNLSLTSDCRKFLTISVTSVTPFYLVIVVIVSLTKQLIHCNKSLSWTHRKEWKFLLTIYTATPLSCICFCTLFSSALLCLLLLWHACLLSFSLRKTVRLFCSCPTSKSLSVFWNFFL